MVQTCYYTTFILDTKHNCVQYRHCLEICYLTVKPLGVKHCWQLFSMHVLMFTRKLDLSLSLIPLCTRIHSHHSILEHVDSHLSKTCSSLDPRASTLLQKTSKTFFRVIHSRQVTSTISKQNTSTHHFLLINHRVQ